MKVAIIGGSGYGAVELARFLHHHPHVELAQIFSQSQAGTAFTDIYPQMVTITDQPMADLKLEDLADEIEGSVWFDTFPKVADYLKENIEAGDLVLTLGCGDVYKIAKIILSKD